MPSFLNSIMIARVLWSEEEGVVADFCPKPLLLRIKELQERARIRKLFENLGSGLRK